MQAPAAELVEVIRALTDDPARGGVFCDVDGTLAPIVERAENAHVPQHTSRLLGILARRYGAVACISGRSATEARRLVGVGSITYAGAHGAELLEAKAARSRLLPAVESWEEPVRRFAGDIDLRKLRLLRVRVEEKGPIVALHWRGAPDEQAALKALGGVAAEAEAAGLSTHWGRKVLELRPPVEFSKGNVVAQLVRRSGVRAVLFGGDDATDLDAFDALDDLLHRGEIETAVRVGVRSDEGPAAIVARADLAVDGVAGFAEVLEALAAA